MISKEDNLLFLEAIESKNYPLVNHLVKNGLPNLNYNRSNDLESQNFSIYLNRLKFYLRELYLDGEFYAAQKIISKFNIKRSQQSGEATLTREDLVTIGEHLIINNSPNIHFLWNQFFKLESNNKFLIRFTMTAIQTKNTNFLSSYDNIKNIFKTPLLLRNCINQSFSKTLNVEFFHNLHKFYFVYNPSFDFKNNLMKSLNHQLLIRNTESLDSEQFKQIESLYSTYFPNFHSFKLASGLLKTLKNKPENNMVFNSYIEEIFKLHDLETIKEQGGFLFKNNPELNAKFKLFKKLNANLVGNNEIKNKINKI